MFDDDAELLAQLHHAEGRTPTDIARLYGSAPETVRAAMRRHGIEIRKRSQRPAILDDQAWLVEQYVEQRRSPPTIARLAGCSDHAVRAALDRAGIERRGRPAPRHRRLRDAEWLHRRHVVEDVSLVEIAAELDVTDTEVFAAMCMLHVPLRRWAT